MMQYSTEKDFQAGFSSLEDLKGLSDYDLSPLIYRVQHHFLEAKRGLEGKDPKLKDYPVLKNFIELFLLKQMKRIKHAQAQKIIYHSQTIEELDLSLVDKILEFFPLVISCICKIPFTKSIEIQINSNGVSFTAPAQITQEFEKHRIDFYRLTRLLLRESILLTYKLSGLNADAEGELRINLCFAKDRDKVYGLDFTQEHGIILGLPAILPMYRIHSNERRKLGRHLCVEVTNQLKVEKSYRLSSRYFDDQNQNEILHFAFLFRPVSIIIPKEGALYDAHLFECNGGTGSDKINFQHDVEKKATKTHRFIDLFPLLSC